jgi:hypothetical protein
MRIYEFFFFLTLIMNLLLDEDGHQWILKVDGAAVLLFNWWKLIRAIFVPGLFLTNIFIIIFLQLCFISK